MLARFVDSRQAQNAVQPAVIQHFPFTGLSHVVQPILNDHPMTIGAGVTYTSIPTTPGNTIDEQSDDEALSSVATPSVGSLSSPSLSSECSPVGKAASSATSPTTQISPAHNMLKALHAAKLTTKAEPVSKPEYSEATRLKRSFSEISGRTPSGKRLMGENDPENREIMRLRQDENLEFDEIARIMNKNRVKAHLPATFTANAIYSRYKRNGPLIAASDGKEFVPAPRDKKPNGTGGINFKKAFILEAFDADEDELLVRAVKEVDDKKWSLVAARLHELGGSVHAPEMCSTRYANL